MCIRDSYDNIRSIQQGAPPKHAVEPAKHHEAIAMFENQGFADELMKFIYSQQTANMLIQPNPQTKELEKILLRFDQLWFRYFPHGRISPADWVLPPADEIDTTPADEQSRKQYHICLLYTSDAADE